MHNTVRDMNGRINGSESRYSPGHDFGTVWGHSERSGPRARCIYEHGESAKLRTTPKVWFLVPRGAKNHTSVVLIFFECLSVVLRIYPVVV